MVDEKIVATADRDGGLQNLEIKGDILIRVIDPTQACLRLSTSLSGDSAIQFKVSIM